MTETPVEKVAEVVEHPVFPRFIVRYIALMITLLLVLGIANGYRIQHNVCVGQNEVRATFSDYLESQLAQTRAADFRELFPSVPPHEADKLKQRSLDSLQAGIAALAPKDCGFGF